MRIFSRRLVGGLCLLFGSILFLVSILSFIGEIKLFQGLASFILGVIFTFIGFYKLKAFESDLFYTGKNDEE
ncbi:MAG: hypothetical protein PHT40_00490 [Patescibacteria group bacterium]|nr:hypothetical protein [Patescibacteria group bacterium]